MTPLEFHRYFSTDDSGELGSAILSFGRYHLQVQRESFSSYDAIVEIHSALPLGYVIKLNIAA